MRAHRRSCALRLGGVALALAGAAGGARAQALDSAWAPWRPLVGSWTLEGSAGAPGAAAAGGFSFTPELDGRVLVRRDWSTYPATNDHPAFRHEAVMYIYPQPGGFRAMYWDNEGHVIPYTVGFAGSDVVLTSDLPAAAPRFRLTHRPQPDGRLYTLFEIAPPGQEFRKYVEGTARRAP